MISRMAVHDPSKHSIDEVMMASTFIGDIMTEEEEQWSVTGFVQVIDIEGAIASHGLQLTPAFVKKAMIIWQVGKNSYKQKQALRFVVCSRNFAADRNRSL